jgi:5-methylcytosine-specific restriction endonuclease McrA
MPSAVNLDMVGKTFGRWKVLQRGPNRLRSEMAMLCQCECGTESWVRPTSLKLGESKSCGCLRASLVDGSRFVGNRYGLLTVLEKLPEKDYGGAWLYRCKCDCGTERIYPSKRFAAARRGAFQSCGCKRGVRLPKGEGGFNNLFSEYSRGAASRGFAFELGREEFRELTKRDCFYCGSPPEQIKTLHKAATGHAAYAYNGIDRIDNSSGYVVGNVVSCCSPCNKSKGTMKQDEFIELANKIARHQAQQIAIEP